MIDKKGILFVEGADDQHTIWAICEHFKVEETFIVEIPDSQGKINKKAKPHEKGGIENVLKATQGYLATQNIERFGIVIDADNNSYNQWQRVKSILEKVGYKDLPQNPHSEGTIIKQDEKTTFGVWIMPDNKERGFLETFLTYLIKDDDKTWEQAKNCVDNLENKPFIKEKVDHTEKAQVHTFLAWQEEPGKPFGQAITAKYLQAENPECEKFVNWLKRIFVE